MAVRVLVPTVLLSAAVLLAPAGWAQGELVFERTNHDFGEINAGDQVSTTFTFLNRGSEPLTIVEVRPSCGCTVPHFTASPVPPGAEGELEVAFDATGRAGRVRQSVVVTADVGRSEAERISLVITAEVVPAGMAHGVMQGGVRFDTDEVDLGRVPAGEPLSHTFLMQRVGPGSLVVRATHSFPEGADVKAPAVPIVGEVVVGVEVTLPGHLVEGDFDVMVALETDDRYEPIKALRLFGVAD